MNPGEGIVGESIDRNPGYKFPYYAMDNSGNIIQGNLVPGNFLGTSRPNTESKPAIITDIPGRDDLPVGDTLDFSFETAAVVVAGPDAGTYLGSVSWGFKFDAQGNFQPKLLSLVSPNRPSNDFLAAAAKWNANKVSINGIITPAVPLPL